MPIVHPGRGSEDGGIPIHALPTDLCPAAGCFLHLVLLAGFHAGLSTLHSTWLGPVGEACTLSPAGSALILVQDEVATISVIANTGAMLDIGQETLHEINGLNCRTTLCARF
jgi:hypothetical protein